MKIYAASYNGILDEYKAQIEYASPLDADKIVTWQDCAGGFKEMIGMSRKFFPKPVYTVQHGRRASRDYGLPLKKTFQSDKFLAWGKWDYDNMTALGYPVEIVGCPLNTWIKPKVAHKEKVILFLPVNSGKEEPDNITVYCELLKMKLSKVQQGVITNYDVLKKQWDNEKITKHTLSDNFTVLAANLPWHDRKFYTEGVVKCYQDSAKSQRTLFEMIRNADVVVSTDEGTAALFAVAHDVPVVVVDGFNYKWKECDVEIPVTQTPGMNHCRLEELQDVIEWTLANPDALKAERLQIAENEMSLVSIPDPVSRLHAVIGSK
jgi:hypothetical protein